MTMSCYFRSLLLMGVLASLQACSVLPKGLHPVVTAGSHAPVGTDGVLQGIVESAAECTMRQDHPKRISVVVVDPRSGQILAECSRRRNSEKETDDACTWDFQPTTAYKPFIIAAALEDGCVSEQSVFDCGNGVAMFSGQPLKDHKPYGRLTVADIVRTSSNIGVARIGARMPSCEIDRYALAFGFGKKSGICRPAENPGRISAAGSNHERTKILCSLGRGVTATPLQLAMAYATIANGGLLLKPKDDWDEPPTTVRRVISEKTSGILRTMLSQVVSMRGTAPLAAVEGVSAGGKAGTSQVILPGGAYFTEPIRDALRGFLPR